MAPIWAQGAPDEYMSQPSDDTHMGQPSDDTYMGQPSDDTYMSQPSDDTYRGQPWADTYMGQPWADTYMENDENMKACDQVTHIFHIHIPYMIDISLPCLLYTSPSPRDRQKSRMPSSA